MTSNQSAHGENSRALTRPKVLFLAGSTEDYLGDGLFLGLRALLGPDVVDHPRMDAMYETMSPSRRRQLYGRGFSLYGSLPDLEVDRLRIEARVADGGFDAVIFSDIHRTFGRFIELLPILGRTKVAVLDGADSPAMYPYSGQYWRRPERWFLPRAHHRFLYFKREWTTETLRSRYYRLAPAAMLERMPAPENLRQIAFSFPDEKILDPAIPALKKTLFPCHIVDPDVRARVAGASTSYAFDSEAAYYADLQGARFGITTKRRGWDCLRHYELAANGAVPCFRDLAHKPFTCAPHGLSEENCVSYTSADELLARVEAMSETEYQSKRRGALEWAQRSSTRSRARQVLDALGFHLQSERAGA